MVLPIASGGVGLAGVVGGTVLLALASQNAEAYRTGPFTDGALGTRVQRQTIAGGVTLAVAGVALTAAVVLWLLD